MNTDTAIALIGNMVYKPGWEFTAEDNTGRFEGSIKLTVRYPCVDSNRDRAAAGYPETDESGTATMRPDGKARASYVLMVCDCDDDVALWHLVAQMIMNIEEHEMREFLRITPTYWAPFHPHRSDGMKRWAAVTGKPVEHIVATDLTFGLA